MEDSRPCHQYEDAAINWPVLRFNCPAARTPAFRSNPVAGVDPSNEMIVNEEAIKARRVDLRLGSAGSLPFEDNVFDKVLAINSMQIWPDAVAGLCEMERVTKEGGIIALGFTP
jgi:ubiquinone/menaquinone biosynthesis C-methylase UbiE